VASQCDGTLAALEAREAELAAEIKERSIELGKVRTAIGALRSFSAVGDRSGTYDLLRVYIATLPPDAPVGVDDALAYAVASGWESFARDRRIAMLTAMAKLEGSGEIRRVGHGRYRTNSQGEDDDHA